MKTLSIAEARKNLSDVLGRVHYGHERVDITKHEKLYATVISPEERDFLDGADKLVRKKGLPSKRDLLRWIEEMDKEHSSKDESSSDRKNTPMPISGNG